MLDSVARYLDEMEAPKRLAFTSVTMFWTGIVVVAFIFAQILAAKADIRIDRGSGVITAWITDAITNRDAIRLQDISSELEYIGTFRVWLDSKGGDVSAAIKIGKLVRKYDGRTVIADDGKCYSSCALIFIAGVTRASFGELGLHRPYLSTAPQSRETLEKQVPLMLSMLKNYVNEMGITDNFYQVMVNTEPSRMAIYYWDDYTKLVPEIDPVYAEVETARDARIYGITTSEMRQREQDAKGCDGYLPGDSSRYLTCVEAIKWGLSDRVYLERHANAERCKVSDEERATASKTPAKLWRDLPFVIRFETCQREIMRGAPDGWEEVPQSKPNPFDQFDDLPDQR